MAHTPEDIDTVAQHIIALHPEAADRKAYIRDLVARAWPGLPRTSRLKAPAIQEYPTAPAASGVVLRFKDRGYDSAFMVEAGSHYDNDQYRAGIEPPRFTIFGGFATLAPAANAQPVTERKPLKIEDARESALGELRQELCDDKGNPILDLEPSRLRIRDGDIITLPSGRPQIVFGFEADLTPDEARAVNTHIGKLKLNGEYLENMRKRTINPDTGKPEVHTIRGFTIKDLAGIRDTTMDAKVLPTLLYADQRSLFRNIYKELAAGRGAGF